MWLPSGAIDKAFWNAVKMVEYLDGGVDHENFVCNGKGCIKKRPIGGLKVEMPNWSGFRRRKVLQDYMAWGK